MNLPSARFYAQRFPVPVDARERLLANLQFLSFSVEFLSVVW
jgi:hypothetical protein